MDAAHLDLSIFHGCIFREVFELRNDDETNCDVTGWTAQGQIRKAVGGELIAEITVEFDEDNALMTLEMDVETVGSIADGRYLYDVLLSKVSGEPERFLSGSITKESTVTV